MENYKGDVDINFLNSQISDARKSLNSIRKEFKDDQDLLDIYEPSAVHLVNELEAELSKILSIEYGIELKHEAVERSKIDFWVSLDGEEFEGGRGPIGQVGTFLTRLNNANKQAILVISEKLGKVFKASEVPSLSLADTAVGSLKIGLKGPEIKEPPSLDNQAELFDEEHRFIEDWGIKKEEKESELEREAIDISELPAKGMQLLVRAIASVNDDDILHELEEQYGSKQVIKLLHYAKELAPSNRSPIDSVVFEGAGLDIPGKRLRTDKDTRRKLSDRAKNLVPTTKYIEGTALIGQADFDNQYLVARPLKYSNTIHDDIRCLLMKPLDPETIRSFFTKEVGIKGFIVYDRANVKLLRLEIDDIWLLNTDEDED